METVNYTDRNIRDFTPKDTIYIKKMLPSGHAINFLCQFVKFEKGIVHGIKISCDPTWGMHPTEKGTAVTARLAKCYLWGKAPNQSHNQLHNICHWFGKDGYAK